MNVIDLVALSGGAKHASQLAAGCVAAAWIYNYSWVSLS